MKIEWTTLVGTLLLAAATGLTAQSGGPLGTPIPERPLGSPVGDDVGPQAFLANQLTFDRVATARTAVEERLRRRFEAKGVAYPASEIYLRVFKHERALELWARSDADAPFELIKSYPVCALPGQLGPKRRLGDVQVPEGFYFIDEFNPKSDFHLSLRVSYPNLSDRLRRQSLSLGGDIYVHGGCATVGCVPIENHNIEEVYWLAVQATQAGQRIIPIHIFPTRLEPDRIEWLEDNFSPEPDLLAFWRNLAEGYSFFQESRQVPWVNIASDGTYAVPPRPRLAADDADTARAAVEPPDTTGENRPRDDGPPRP